MRCARHPRTPRAIALVVGLALASALAIAACEEVPSDQTSSSTSSSASTTSSASTGGSSGTVMSTSTGMDTGSGTGGRGGGLDCYPKPMTHLELINACTDAQKIDPMPILPLLEPGGALPPLP